MNINFDEFSKVDLRVAKIVSVERIEGSDKLLKLQLSAGDKDETGADVNRQIVAGIGKTYEPEILMGKEIVIVANLEPRSLMGIESRGMLLAAKDENGLSVLLLDKDMKPGSHVG